MQFVYGTISSGTSVLVYSCCGLMFPLEERPSSAFAFNSSLAHHSNTHFIVYSMEAREKKPIIKLIHNRNAVNGTVLKVCYFQ